jgi:hypothetical protein
MAKEEYLSWVGTDQRCPYRLKELETKDNKCEIWFANLKR